MRVLDLFSGMGGLGTGFSNYFNVETAIDWDHDSITTYKNNHKYTQTIEKDIRNINFSKQDYQGVTGVVGGAPCQDFSILNKHRNSNSKRANLLYEMLRVTEEIKPNFVLIENVATTQLSKKNHVIKTLENLNYKVVSKIINASDYGSVQIRKRWIVLATKKKFIYPNPTYSQKFAKEILLDEKSEITARKSTLEKIQHLKFGEWDNLPGQKFKCYFVVDPEKHIGAIVNPTKARYVKPDRSGYLSINEIKQAQGFSKKYEISGKLNSIGQQLANAVPVELALEFAKVLSMEFN